MRWLFAPMALILAGGVAGVFSGLFGIGGGLVMVPIFTLFLKMEAHRATATSLAVVVLPVALPAVIRFHRAGNIDWRIVPWVALGFAIFSLLGARINLGVSDLVLRRMFAVLLIAAAVQMAMKPSPQAPVPTPPAHVQPDADVE
jgi:uncharacterized protein